MRVHGEAFLLVNGWMNFLSLCLAAGLARARLSLPRALGASALGAGYAVLAWSVAPWARGLPALATATGMMALVAFGRQGLRKTPFLLAGGWLLGGCADFWLVRGGDAWTVMLISGGIVLGLLLLKKAWLIPSGGAYAIDIRWRGRTARLPALRDSGNLLSEGIGGLPVIVAPEAGIRALMPPGVRTGDLSTLPPGWRLVRVRTAAGERTLMCFRPDRVILRQGKKQWRVEAAVAAADFAERRALLPEALFDREEEKRDAGV